MIQVILGNKALYGSSQRNALKLCVCVLHFLSKFEKNKSFSCTHFGFQIRVLSLRVRVFGMIQIMISGLRTLGLRYIKLKDESAFPGLDLSALLIFYDFSDLGSLILIIPIRNASLDFKPSHTLPLSASFRLNPQIKYIKYFDVHIRAVTKGWELAI